MQNVKLLFVVTFYTEDCVLNFEISFYLLKLDIDMTPWQFFKKENKKRMECHHFVFTDGVTYSLPCNIKKSPNKSKITFQLGWFNIS